MPSIGASEVVILLTVVWWGVWKLSSHFFTGRIPSFLAWFAVLMVQTFRPF